MEGLNYLGADDALSNQFITLRIRNIDRDVLKNKLGGTAGSLASAGMFFVDASPKAALDVVKPFIVSEAKKYGIDAEVTVSNVPPSKGGRAISEFFPGFVLGVGIGGASLAIVKLIARIFRR